MSKQEQENDLDTLQVKLPGQYCEVFWLTLVIVAIVGIVAAITWITLGNYE